MRTWLSYICPAEDCGLVIELETEVEPADFAYGADADGNRGMYVPASVYAPEAPASCPECGTVYTPEQLADVTSQLAEAAAEWSEPDLYDDEWPDAVDDYPEDYH